MKKRNAGWLLGCLSFYRSVFLSTYWLELQVKEVNKPAITALFSSKTIDVLPSPGIFFMKMEEGRECGGVSNACSSFINKAYMRVLRS